MRRFRPGRDDCLLTRESGIGRKRDGDGRSVSLNTNRTGLIVRFREKGRSAPGRPATHWIDEFDPLRGIVRQRLETARLGGGIAVAAKRFPHQINRVTMTGQYLDSGSLRDIVHRDRYKHGGYTEDHGEQHDGTQRDQNTFSFHKAQYNRGDMAP